MTLGAYDFAFALRARPVLVTGAGGFVGRALVAALVQCGARVTILSRGPITVPAGTTALRGDLADSVAMARAVAGQEVIFNLAYDVRASGPANLSAFECLLQAAVAEGRARIIHTSSIVTYDDWPNGRLTETSSSDAPLSSAYALCKRTMEQVLMASPLPAAILQPTLVWGPGSSLWTESFARVLAAGGTIMLPTPEGQFQGVFVDDLVQALLRAACLPDLGRERFIINGPAPFGWSELLEGYRTAVGRGTIIHAPAASLAPKPAGGTPKPHGPSLAARISALGRRTLGTARFEAVVTFAKRHFKGPQTLRPDAHLFALMTATGTCPPTHAMARLGYRPEYDLQKGLAEIMTNRGNRP